MRFRERHADLWRSGVWKTEGVVDDAGDRDDDLDVKILEPDPSLHLRRNWQVEHCFTGLLPQEFDPRGLDVEDVVDEGQIGRLEGQRVPTHERNARVVLAPQAG